MRLLCPRCGHHHEVARVLEDGHGESRPGVYQVAPLPDCPETSLSESDLLEAAALHGEEAIQHEDTDD